MTTIEQRIDGLPVGALVGGKWLQHTTAGTMHHVNPATGRVTRDFPVGGASEVDAAVAAADAALGEWRRWSPAERRDVLLRIAEMLRVDAEDFGVITTIENGMPASMAAHMAVVAADWFAYYAGWADKVTGDVVPMPGGLDYTVPEPFGVVAIVLTWNGPIATIGLKVAAALAAGCTVVIKPPELAPFSTTVFGSICQEAGIPAGVVNIVPGAGEVGDALVRHPRLDKISFTGGPATARRIQAACADALTPLTLELGGKSATIITATADLDAACTSVALGLAAMSGQVCVAPTRVLAHAAVYDEVVDRTGRLLQGLRIGDPFDPETAMGPLISATAVDRVLGAIERAVTDEAGTLAFGGTRLGGPLADGYFVEPAMFTDVDNSSALAQEELFGPVLAVTQFAEEDEALRLANDSPYGLAAYVYTDDLTQAHRLAAGLDVGNVAVNGGLPVAGPYAPFGGFKDSGYGKEGGYAGLLEFLRTKNVNISLT